ncbi:unnamed protein product [Orchesella dallaii]|uniref:C2H2-type domain-containing protein n=1 Tax=Orchesella dallaii TaxID=48710 RepID=A0ABP1QYC2_9HEXA
MEENIAKLCLFCASTCDHSTAQVKREVFITPDLDILANSTPHQPQEDHEPTLTLTFEGDLPSHQHQSNLKGFFILQKILKLPQSSLLKLICQNEGQFHSERWTNVCQSCSPFLSKHLEIHKEISKLERALTQIEEELKGRISSSKDNLGGTPDWVQIRKEVLNYYSPVTATDTETAKCEPTTGTINTDDHPSFDEEPGPSTQSYDELPFDAEGLRPSTQDYDDVPIDEEFKIYVEQLYGDGKTTPQNDNVNDSHSHNHPAQSISPTIPNQDQDPLATNSSLAAPIKNIAPWKAAPSSKKRNNNHKRFRSCKLTKTNQQRYGHLSFNLEQGTLANTRFIYCTKCPYKTQRWARFAAHSKAHEEGSGGLPCDVCGIYVLPNKMGHHKGRLHSDYKKFRNTSMFFLNDTQSNRRWWYKCDKCPFSGSQVEFLRKHEKAHEPGANAVICGDCGWYVLPEKLALHQGQKHNRSRENSEKEERLKTLRQLREQKGKEKQLSSAPPTHPYKCDKCPFFASCKRLLRRHAKVHEPGSNAVVCEVCGWSVLPKSLAQHQSRMHPQLFQQKRNKRKGRVQAFLKEHAELSMRIPQDAANPPGDAVSAAFSASTFVPVLPAAETQGEAISFSEDFSKTLLEFGITPLISSSGNDMQVTTRSRSLRRNQNHLYVETQPIPNTPTATSYF